MNTTRNPVGWFEIYEQDMNRAKAFYEATFDLKLDELPSPGMKMLAFPMQSELPGCAGALVKYEGKPSGDGGTLVYFPVRIAPSKRRRQPRVVAGFSRRSSRLVSTDTSRWSTIPRATCSVCTRCGDATDDTRAGLTAPPLQRSVGNASGVACRGRSRPE